MGVGRGGRVFYPGHRNKEYVRAVKLYIVHRYTGTVKVVKHENVSLIRLISSRLLIIKQWETTSLFPNISNIIVYVLSYLDICIAKTHLDLDIKLIHYYLTRGIRVRIPHCIKDFSMDGNFCITLMRSN